MPYCALGMIWYRCFGSTHIYTQFDDLNTGNSASELPDFKKGLCGPLSIPSPTFVKLAAHFKVYWNPWLIPVSQWTTVAPRRSNAKHFKHWLSLSSSETEIWRRDKREASYLNPHMLAWAGWMPTSQSCYRVGNCIKLPHNYNLELYSAKSYHCLEINKLSMNKSAT